MKTSETHEIFGHRCARRDHYDPHGERRWDVEFPYARPFQKVKSSGSKRSKSAPSQSKSAALEQPQELSLRAAVDAALGQCPKISTDPNIMEGQPYLTGTYIPVCSVLRVIER
jgi:hypothetical protein